MKKPIVRAQFVYYTKKEKNGIAPIYLRLTQCEKSCFISSPFKVNKRQWNKKKHIVTSSHHQSGVINNYIRVQLAEISEILLENPNMTKEELKQLLNQKQHTAKDLISVYQRFIDVLNQDGNYDEAKHAIVVINKLKAYYGKETIPFNSVTDSFVTDFQNYLHKKIKNSANTVNKEMQRLKRVLEYAKKCGFISKVPFENYKRLKRTRSRKVKLSLSQINKLEQLDYRLDPKKDLVRDTFIFSFYTGGIRFGDICVLKWENIKDGNLVYAMSKTGLTKNVPLVQKALDILDKYKPKKDLKSETIFPIIPDYKKLSTSEIKKKKSSKNARFNLILKKIAHDAGFDEMISFHISRHSFADYARSKNIPISDIKNMLGHTSISITETYIKDLDAQSMDNSMKKMFG